MPKRAQWNSGLYRDNKHLFGPTVDRWCPFDESRLRHDAELPTHDICPCCWTSFAKEPTNA
jgi:hypothetical protein